MDPETILTSAIEVAIGIAGFSGVVAAVSSSRADWSPVAGLYFQILLLMSIGNIGLAFVPMLLLTAGLAAFAVWTYSSCVAIVWQLGITVVRIQQVRRLGNDAVLQSPLLPAMFAVLSCLFALHLVNAFIFHEAWPYALSVVVVLLSSFGYFVALLREIWPQ